MQVGDESSQLQALVSDSIRAAALTPPYVFMARDKFKMNVLESSIDKFSSIQQGIGVHVKNLQANPDWLRRLLRVKAKAAPIFPRGRRDGGNLGAAMEKRLDERASMVSALQASVYAGRDSHGRRS